MKRSRDIMGTVDMAKCLMLLSQSINNCKARKVITNDSKIDVFECKTCNKKFPSFQALGGHRASHRRPKLASMDQEKEVISTNKKDGILLDLAMTTKKSNLHECNICGTEFPTGQALGGHMRRHRANVVHENSMSSDRNVNDNERVPKLPVLKRCNSSKRVFGLDLNLTPLENDLEILFGKKMAPKVDLSFIV